MSARIQEIVCEKIVEALEAGTVPWKQPYLSGQNLPLRFTGRWVTPYRGINLFVLWVMGAAYQRSCWMTINQARSIGARLKKGQKGKYAPVIFFKMIEQEDGSEIPLMRFYQVYNVGQFDDVPEKLLPALPKAEDWEKIANGEEVIRMLADRGDPPKIIQHDGVPHYNPALDHIGMPRRESFVSAEGYYSTLFHEVVHWTGHGKRLDRKLSPVFMKQKYAREELIAEMGAAIINSACGIDPITTENSASYIEGWSKYVKEKRNHKHVFEAAREAQKAATYLFGGEWLTECKVCNIPLTMLNQKIRGLCHEHSEEEDAWLEKQGEAMKEAT